MTLQKEFYANFIVQRLTLKVINLGHALSSFQRSVRTCADPELDDSHPVRLPTADYLSSQANGDFNLVAEPCQARRDLT